VRAVFFLAKPQTSKVPIVMIIIYLLWVLQVLDNVYVIKH